GTKLKGVTAALDTSVAAQADSGSTAQYAGLGAVPVVTETIVAESEEEDADAAAQNVAEPTVSEPPVELQTSAPEVVMEEEASLHNEGLTSEPKEEALSISENILDAEDEDRKSTRLNSSHVSISYAVFCLKKKKNAGLDDRGDREQKPRRGERRIEETAGRNHRPRTGEIQVDKRLM